MTKFEQTDISAKVMRQIRERNIVMRPRWYFVARRISFFLAIIITLASSIFFLNLVVFKFRIYDPLGYFWFGASGFKAAMGSANWELVFAAILSVLAFFWIIKFSRLWYFYKPGFTIAAFLILMTVSAISFDKTGVNDRVRSEGKYPILYAGEYADDYWVMGKVIGMDIRARNMHVLTPDKEMVFVTWDSVTKLPNGSAFTLGNTVQVVGHLQGTIFKAQGITIR